MPTQSPPEARRRLTAKYVIRAGPFTVAKGTPGCCIPPTPRILASFPAIADKVDSTQVLVKFDGVPELIVHVDQLAFVD